MVETGSGAPRRPDDIRHAPAHDLPKATPREGTPVQPAGAPIPPGAPTRPIVQSPPSGEAPPRVWGTPPASAPAGPGVPQPPGLPQTVRLPRPGTPPEQTAPPADLSQTGGWPRVEAQPGGAPPSRAAGAAPPPDLPQPGGSASGTAGEVEGAAAVNRWSGVGGSPSAGQSAGSPRTGGGTAPGGAEWAGVPEAQDAYSGREERSSTTGPMGVRETSGVQVRLGSLEQERERRARRRAGRRSGLVAAGVLILAGLVTIGLILTPGSGDDDGTGAVPAGGEQRPGGDAELPDAGAPITVGTADGSKYKIATVGEGVSDGVAPTSQSAPPSGTSFPYIEYILSNPSGKKVLLDFPGDVFVKRDLVVPDARGRCMPQAGVPEDMCTPPTKSQVVRRLAGGELIPGDGGDKYMPPGSAFLVRATVDVPVDRDVKRSDMGLYVWKQLYMADQLAKQAPFPK